MRIPESWLREFCDPDLDTQALADTLTMGGFEVEALLPAAPPFEGVMVGRIIHADKHPDADRLQVCTVDTGTGEPLQIVCGAPNARVGIRVPCAVVGAKLPPTEEGGPPFKIKRAKLRGVESRGMLCSARELGLSQDHSGLLELADSAPVGADIRKLLDLDETIFEISLTPDLGHALSVLGMARELSALTGTALKQPAWPLAPVTTDDELSIRVQASDLCGRFSGRIVQGIDATAQTPAWMVERLRRCGQRSVNALVDISNYVMFELGRPTHMFDRDKLAGGLSIRWGQDGEQLELLNGQTVQVDGDVGVIADDNGPQSLAGIMGGQATAVSDRTRSVFIEAAFWWPQAMAGRARRFNFSTDASHRFERGVDASTTVEHIERLTQLLLEICGRSDTRCGPIVDQQVAMPERAPVRLRPARAGKILGMPVSAEQCERVLQRLGFDHEVQRDAFVVTPPTHRFDITIEEDLIEELARILGYQNLPDRLPQARLRPRVRSETRRSPFELRQQMRTLGFVETINFSFVDEQWERELMGNDAPIRLLNPIASQMSVMRSGLLGSLLHAVQYNVQRRVDDISVFELGRVFWRDDSVVTSNQDVRGVCQPMRIAGMRYGRAMQANWGGHDRQLDFYDIKGDVELLLDGLQVVFKPASHPAYHPGRCASVWLQDQQLGHLGQLHPNWRQSWQLPYAPVMFELDLQAVLQHMLPEAQAVPRQLPVERDLAIVVAQDMPYDHLVQAVRDAVPAQRLLSVKVFDVFSPVGDEERHGLPADHKSVALHLRFVSDDAADLTDDAVRRLSDQALQGLITHCGARLRH